jgi:hypothetical protein
MPSGIKNALRLSPHADYRRCFKDKSYVRSLIVSIILLISCLVVNFYAGTYATNRESSAVTDLVLSNVPLMDVDQIFVGGSVVFWIFVLGMLLLNPKKIPFTFKSIALFTIIRAGFLTLTHIGPFPTREALDPASILNYFTFGGDLFFSGHVGLPFLLALVFWDNKLLRTIFLVSTVVFAFVVLVGHYHYSIDVASAFFITYTIYHIARELFKSDHRIFLEEAPN